MDRSTHLSIVICTFNRASALSDTLSSLLSVDSSGIDFEVMVVDNNSTDETRTVASEFCAQNPDHFRYHREKRQGLSVARNTGIELSKGNIIAFIDDDVLLDRSWMTGLATYFALNPDIDCLGGKVLPHYEAEPPDWLEDHMLWIYGVTRYGDCPMDLKPPQIPIGCNMAFRRSVFESVGIFNNRLGRVGKSLLSNEENEMFYRISQAGMRIGYTPSVLVYHRVPSGRLEKQWVRDRFYWQGVSDVVFEQLIGKHAGTRKRIAIAAKSLIKVIKTLLSRPRTASERCCPRNLLSRHLHVSYQLGSLRGAMSSIHQA